MSWWVSLCTSTEPDAQIVEVEPFSEGGTYAADGSNEADLNVTWNYGTHFDFATLHQMRARDAIPLLDAAVASLGTERASDYWSATPGNAGHACAILLAWARQYPDAWFNVN